MVEMGRGNNFTGSTSPACEAKWPSSVRTALLLRTCSSTRGRVSADVVVDFWAAHTTNSIVVMDAFRTRNLPLPRVSFVTFSVTLRTNLLATGRYVTVLPRSMMSLYARQMNLKVLPVRLARRKWPVVLVTLKHRTLNPVARTFIEHLRASAKTLESKIEH